MAKHYGAEIQNVEIAQITSEYIILSDGKMIRYSNIVPVLEAPDDGKEYSRKGKNWNEIVYPVGEAPQDNKVYGRKDGQWFEIIIPDNLSVSKDHKYKLIPLVATTTTLTIQAGECLDDTNQVLMVIPSDEVLDITTELNNPDPNIEVYVFVIADSNGENATVKMSVQADASDILINDYVGGYKRRIKREKLDTNSQLRPYTAEAKIGSNYKAVEVTWDTRYTKAVASGTVSHIFPCPNNVELVGYHRCYRANTSSGYVNITFKNIYIEKKSDDYSWDTSMLTGCKYGANVNTVSSGLSVNEFSVSGYIEDVQ